MPAPIVEVAWAAGFFDGEGSTSLLNAEPKRRRDYPTPRMSISQHGPEGAGIPEVLTRFHAAVEGIGRIYGPHDYRGQGLYRQLRWTWQTTRTDEPAKVLAILSYYLGEVKMAQATEVLAAYTADAATRRPYTRKEG